jgi:hypothetical protein
MAKGKWGGNPGHRQEGVQIGQRDRGKEEVCLRQSASRNFEFQIANGKMGLSLLQFSVSQNRILPFAI